jgi:hypothetical protein
VSTFWKILIACSALALILWPVRDSTDQLLVILHGLVGAIAYSIIVCGLDVAQSRRPCARVLQRGFAYMRTALARS